MIWTFWYHQPWFGGLLFLAGAWAVAGLFAGFNPARWWRGADKRPSTSKFQFVLWNGLVLFVFGSVVTKYFAAGVGVWDDRNASFPENVLIALGLSGVTAVAAKAITVGYLATGRLTKTTAAVPPATTTTTTTGSTHPTGGLMTTDEGEPDLTKIQIVAWTVVALVIYFFQFVFSVGDILPVKNDAPAKHVPDIDTVLMVLMGLSQGTYIGNKLVTMDTPRVTSVTVDPARNVVVDGAAFGVSREGSSILIDGNTINAAAVWTDTQVRIALPPHIGPGKHTLALLVGGRASAGVGTFSVTPVLQAAALKAGVVTLTGHTFGSTTGIVYFDDSVVDAAWVTSWADKQVQVKLPPGTTLTQKRAVVEAQGEKSAPVAIS